MTEISLTMSRESLNEQLARHKADLAEQRQRATEAQQRVKQALQNGEDADDAVRQRVEAEARVGALTELVAEIEDLIPQVEAAEVKREAERRMLGVKKATGSLANEYEQDALRVAADAEALAEAVDRMNARYAALTVARGEAMILAERFGLEQPDLPSPPVPAKVRIAADAMSRVPKLDAPRELPPRLSSMFYDGVGFTVSTLMGRIAGTPTGRLLARAGAGILGDRAAWEAQRTRIQNEGRDRQDAARLAEIKKATAWLEAQLAEGPQPVKALEARAKADGIIFEPSFRPGNRDATVRAAASRLEVVGLIEEAQGPIWWALPRQWDSTRFRLAEQSTLSVTAFR